MINLPPRLKAISKYIKDSSSIVDIGCDHALLDIFLASTYKNIKITASDINKNALDNAKKNIKKYKLNNRIKTILSDGLNNIDTTNIDTIVISGMGSHTIVGILQNNLSKIKHINRLIIQSNNDLDFLRYKLTKLGYYIKSEELVKDSKIIYTIIEFVKGYKFYTKKELYFGPYLIKEKNNLFIEKYTNDLSKIEKFYPLIPKKNISYRLKTKWRINNIKKILKNK